MTKFAFAARGVGILTVLALSCALSACVSARPDPTAVVGAPPIVWDNPPTGQDFASGPAGAIALKWLEYTPQQFRIYYVFRPSGQPVALQVTASASLPSSPATLAIPLPTTNQTLGQIGAYTVGAIHIGRYDHAGQFVNRANQIITLTITPSLPDATSWQLSPIHQLIVEPHAQTAIGGLGAYPTAMSEAQWYGPVQTQQVSYVKVIIPGQPVADRSYVFVRSDDWVNVRVITKAQYLALAGNENFTP